MKHNATAVWNGTGKEGSGNLSTQSGVLNKTPYSWSDRFAEGDSTNPEELIAAAHAGCFTMKMSFLITAENFTPDTLETICEVTLENDNITSSHLSINARVPGLSAARFKELVDNASKNCIISKLLNTTITVDASLAESN